MLKYKILILTILLNLSLNLFSQNFEIDSIDIKDFPTINVFFSNQNNFKIFKEDIKFYENNNLIDFKLDTFLVSDLNQKKYYLYLINFQTEQQIEIRKKQLIEIIDLLDNKDYINIAYVQNNSKSSNYINFLSAEFTNDKELIKSIVMDYNFEKNIKSFNSTVFIDEITDFFISKNLNSKTKIINYFTFDTLNFNNQNTFNFIKSNLRKNNISFNYFLISDSNKEIIIDKKTQKYFENYNLTQNFIILDNEVVETNKKLLENSNISKSFFYKITYISNSKTYKTEIKIENSNFTTIKYFTSNESKINYFYKNYQGIIWLVLIILILLSVIFYLKNRKIILKFMNFNKDEVISELNNKIVLLEEELKKIKNINFSVRPDYKNFIAKNAFFTTSEFPVFLIKNKEINFLFEITKNIITIGRDKDNDLVINDLSISGKHSILSIDGGEFFIIDNESTNGVFVNDFKIQKSKLNENDLVRIGNSFLKLKIKQ